MGGYGSGKRWGRDVKATVDDATTIDINWLVREGVFDSAEGRGTLRWYDAWGEEFSAIRYTCDLARRVFSVTYRAVDAQQSMAYDIPLTTTDLPWGGVRWWFRCPVKSHRQCCGRRVAKLHLAHGCACFGCRSCLDLTYKSCQESHKMDRFWPMLAGGVAFESPKDAKRFWKDDLAAEWWIDRQLDRNRQRRRRRAAKHWS